MEKTLDGAESTEPPISHEQYKKLIALLSSAASTWMGDRIHLAEPILIEALSIQVDLYVRLTL